MSPGWVYALGAVAVFVGFWVWLRLQDDSYERMYFDSVDHAARGLQCLVAALLWPFALILVAIGFVLIGVSRILDAVFRRVRKGADRD